MRNQTRRLGSVLTLLLAQAACSNGIESLSPATAPAVAATITAISPTMADGTVGEAVANIPKVVVRDATGRPLSGMPVSFSLTKGNGGITGALATTDSTGVARLSGWTLGKTAGPNVVVAFAGSLSDTFTVVAHHGPPAFAVKIRGDNQVGMVGRPVASKPVVRVVDAYGNAAEGVVTLFTVASGGGSVVGETATTDSLGDAAPGKWTLGSVGVQALTATVGALPPVTFVAGAIETAIDCNQSELIDHTTVHADLDKDSCASPDGQFFKTFLLLVDDSSASAHQFTLTSLDFDAEIEVRDVHMNLVARNTYGRKTGPGFSITALLRPGVYAVSATSHKPGVTGAFALEYRKMGSDISGCGDSFVMRGVSTTQMATYADCRRGDDYEDRYSIYLKTDEQVSVSITDESYSGPGLELTDVYGEIFATSTPAGDYERTLTFTAPSSGFYVIGAWGSDDNTTFSLKIR